MTTEIIPAGDFSLRASTRFLEGFTPARYRGGDRAETRMRVAFPVEGSWQTAGAVVTQTSAGRVRVDVEGAAPPGLREQVARILSLDVDGSGFGEVLRRDAVVDGLAEAYQGLRPVCFYSPYEAACWAVIGHRIRITTAAVLKERIAAGYGERRTVDGVELDAFPAPQRLLDVAGDLALPAVKRGRLRGIARAALAGDLDAAYLRSLDPATALAQLQRIDGIGPFSAELILVRGAGAPDVFPTKERRLHESMADLYELSRPTLAELAAVAGRWSPYRSWVSVLIRAHREDSTGEISRGAGTGRVSVRSR